MIHCMIGKMLLNCPETGQCFLFRLEGSPAHNCCQIDFHFVMAGVAVVFTDMGCSQDWNLRQLASCWHLQALVLHL